MNDLGLKFVVDENKRTQYLQQIEDAFLLGERERVAMLLTDYYDNEIFPSKLIIIDHDE